MRGDTEKYVLQLLLDSIGLLLTEKAFNLFILVLLAKSLENHILSASSRLGKCALVNASTEQILLGPYLS